MDNMHKRLREIKLMKIKYLLAVFMGRHRITWLKKNNIFKLLGTRPCISLYGFPTTRS